MKNSDLKLFIETVLKNISIVKNGNQLNHSLSYLKGFTSGMEIGKAISSLLTSKEQRSGFQDGIAAFFVLENEKENPSAVISISDEEIDPDNLPF